MVNRRVTDDDLVSRSDRVAMLVLVESLINLLLLGFLIICTETLKRFGGFFKIVLELCLFDTATVATVDDDADAIRFVLDFGLDSLLARPPDTESH